MEKIKFGVIGIKGFGKFHCAAIHDEPQAELAAVCDVDEEAVNKIADEYGVKAYTDYKEMLADPEIVAVSIVTPDQIHAEMACEAFKAGKHVLCEKPLALHNNDCRDMLIAASEANKLFVVGQECRCAPGFVFAKELYDKGAIGDIFFMESEYAHDYSGMPHHWRNDKENPRHPVTGGGCHAIDLLRWFCGNPIEAYGYTNKKSLNEDWPCDDSAIAVFKFENDVMGKVFVSTGCKRDYTMRTCIYGTKGTIICDNTSNYLTLYMNEYEGKNEMFGCGLKHIGMRFPVGINNHNVQGIVATLCDGIKNGSKPPINGYEGAATVAAAEAVIESAETGKPVVIDYSFLEL